MLLEKYEAKKTNFSLKGQDIADFFFTFSRQMFLQKVTDNF